MDWVPAASEMAGVARLSESGAVRQNRQAANPQEWKSQWGWPNITAAGSSS